MASVANRADRNRTGRSSSPDLIDGPPDLVFEAFTDPGHLDRWYGPNGFTVTTHAFEFRPGGTWDFTMHGPDGTDYPNWIEWLEIIPARADRLPPRRESRRSRVVHHHRHHRRPG